MLKSLLLLACVAGALAGAPTVRITSGSNGAKTPCCLLEVTFTFSEPITGFATNRIIATPDAVQRGTDFAASSFAPEQQFILKLTAKSAQQGSGFRTESTRCNGEKCLLYCFAVDRNQVFSKSTQQGNQGSGPTCFEVRKDIPLIASLTSSYPITNPKYTAVIPYTVLFTADSYLRPVVSRMAGTSGIIVAASEEPKFEGPRIRNLVLFSDRWEFSVRTNPGEEVTVMVEEGAAVDEWWGRSGASDEVSRRQADAGDALDCKWEWGAYAACDEMPSADSAIPWQAVGMRHREYIITQENNGGAIICPTRALLVKQLQVCSSACGNGDAACLDKCQDDWGSSKACDIDAWNSCRGFPAEKADGTFTEAASCVLDSILNGPVSEEESAFQFIDPIHYASQPGGGEGIYTCDCGANCFEYGDCCEDRRDVCGYPKYTSCSGRCGESTDIMGACSCTGSCLIEGNCCDDVLTVCETEYESCKFKGCAWLGPADEGCGCDELCSTADAGCCSDKADFCPSPTIPIPDFPELSGR